MQSWLKTQFAQFTQTPAWIWFLLLIPGLGVILFACYAAIWDHQRTQQAKEPF